MFGFTGAALSKIRHMQNGGKRARHSIDQWDRVCSATSHAADNIANDALAKYGSATFFETRHTDRAQ